MKKLSTILIAILIFLYVPITPSIEAASKLQRHAASVTKTVGEYKFKVTVSPTFNTSSAIYTSQMIVTKKNGKSLTFRDKMTISGMVSHSSKFRVNLQNVKVCTSFLNTSIGNKVNYFSAVQKWKMKSESSKQVIYSGTKIFIPTYNNKIKNYTHTVYMTKANAIIRINGTDYKDSGVFAYKYYYYTPNIK